MFELEIIALLETAVKQKTVLMIDDGTTGALTCLIMDSFYEMKLSDHVQALSDEEKYALLQQWDFNAKQKAVVNIDCNAVATIKYGFFRNDWDGNINPKWQLIITVDDYSIYELKG